MKKNKVRNGALLLFLCLPLMLLTTACQSAGGSGEGTGDASFSEAEADFCEPVTPPALTAETDGFCCSLTEDGTYAVTAYSGGGAVRIPASVAGVPVTAVGDRAFAGNGELTALTVPEGVTRIGAEAFCGCTALSELSLPSTLAAAGPGAFAGTPWLENRTETWVIVGDGVLLKYNGTGQKDISLPKSKLVRYVSDAFRGNTEAVSVKLPDTVRTVGEYAFADCPELTILILPKKLVYIASDSVSGCPKLSVIENK